MKMSEKNKDLCKTCIHYWVDFPLPLDRYVSHCDILDEKYGLIDTIMDEKVPYPCLKCPFDRYVKNNKVMKAPEKIYLWPSDEQMNILFKYAEQNNKDGSILTSLYQNLKKLREE